jgi:hypothetical protein
MGYGDFKLLAALGAWLGWSALPQIILLSSMVGAVTGIAMILVARQERGAAMPFGPYLAAAGWLALMGVDVLALALPAAVGNADFSVTRRDAFGVLNLRAGIEGDNWTLTAFANNAFDKQFLNEVIPAIEFGGSFISPGQRRIIGVEAGVRF